MNNQAKVILVSFLFYASFLDLNKKINDIPEDLKRLYSVLRRLTSMYKEHFDEVMQEVNQIIGHIDKDVDFVLASVSIIAEYYEQTKGKKRFFTPMKWDKICDLQDECLNLSDKNAKDTFDVAELIVKELLK